MLFSNSSSQKWITIGLVFLLVAAMAFVGWAVYSSRQASGARIASLTTMQPVTKAEPLRFYCPLDGTEYREPSSTRKRPIVVQIDNAPAARPPSGISQADIVYEAMAEGQVTRFAAIFGCRDADTIGPVRSARLINIELVPEYDALLANSGSSVGVSNHLAARPDIPNINHPAFPGAYWRTGDRYAPHNLMTSTTGIRDAAAAAGYPVDALLTGLVFKDDRPAAAPLSTISIPYSAWVDVSYRYDPATNSWLRFIGGAAHVDTSTGAQLAARNVIIQFVNQQESDIIEDEGGNRGLEFTLKGTGRALIFQDGQVIEARWSRAADTEVTIYTDAAGVPIPLNRGQTWIQLVPLDFPATWG